MTGAAPAATLPASASPGAGRPRARGIARVLYSPGGRFRSTIFAPAESKRIGRDERADVRISDPELGGVHFELLFDGSSFHALELQGMGKLAVNGLPASSGQVMSGGFIVAGGTTMGLFVEGHTPPAEGLEPTRNADTALSVLGPLRDAGALYGVFDSARDPRIRVLLNEAVDEHASLYEGAAGAALDDVAPYLVKFAPDSRLLERIVSEGWGRSWGTYFASREPQKMVRRHFRRFLMVLDEVKNERVYFRFYDPRVLREFLPITTQRQREELFGALARDEGGGEPPSRVLDAMLYELDSGELVRAIARPEGSA